MYRHGKRDKLISPLTAAFSALLIITLLGYFRHFARIGAHLTMPAVSSFRLSIRGSVSRQRPSQSPSSIRANHPSATGDAYCRTFMAILVEKTLYGQISVSSTRRHDGLAISSSATATTRHLYHVHSMVLQSCLASLNMIRSTTTLTPRISRTIISEIQRRMPTWIIRLRPLRYHHNAYR